MFIQQANSIPVFYVKYQKLRSYFRVGKLLHAFCVLSMVLCGYFVNRLAQGFTVINSVTVIPAVVFFTLIFTTQMDAYSRYQNYKKLKDLLHENGFRERMLAPFSHSRCQRDAASEAAHQLKFKQQTDFYFRKLGYRWYHLIPSVLVAEPKLIFTRAYWSSTLFVRHYKSKYFLW